MRKRRLAFLIAGLVVVGLIGGYFMVTSSPECVELVFMAERTVMEGTEIGSRDSATASLVGIQPEVEPGEYGCPESFKRKMELYLQYAKHKGYLTPKTIVVFPEYIGTWLVLLEAPAAAYIRARLEESLRWFVLKHPWRFWRAYRAAQAEGWKDPAAVAAFQGKAAEMARVYHRTFSELARAYGVTLVAGSIVLPGARIEGDSLRVEPGAPLENVSVVYGPDGRPFPQIVRKAFPIATELTFTRPGRVEALPTFETSLGRLGVLICADSWFPQSYQALGKVDIVVVPSYLMGDSCWGRPWRGYSGWPAPPDVRDTVLTEGQAWLTYALGGRLPRYDSTAVGLNVFLRGQLWELGADGQAIAVVQGKTYTTPAEVVCVWLRKERSP
ncbi:MAG: carbon-nitrogen hydrolase family protein [Bacteroidia bacterium]|nr:carbon-nitrogen hydrolase family protein [Bacteroidia bacterium]GIV22763.1 MAG: carbon-nitrogen hydrolase [Bacteroidia bacterium]